MFQLNVFCRRQKAVSLPSPSPRVAPPMDVRPLWGRTPGGGDCSSAGSPCSPADRVFPIHSAPRGSNNCTHRSARPWTFAPFGDVLGRWGLLFRGFAMLTRGYRVVRPPWGRIPARPTHRRATGRIPHGLHIVVPWVASRTAGASSCHGSHSARPHRADGPEGVALLCSRG